MRAEREYKQKDSFAEVRQPLLDYLNHIKSSQYTSHILKQHTVILLVPVPFENPDKQTLGAFCLILKIWSSLDFLQFYGL